MYEINLVGKAIVKSQKNIILVKILKLLSLFLTFAIIGLCGLVVYTFLMAVQTNENIMKLRGSIDEKRRIHKIKDVEAEWTLNYNKMLAIQDLTSNNTKTGLLLRDVGLYIPPGDKIVTFALTPENKMVELLKLNDIKAIHEYADILAESYSRSTFFGEPIEIDGELKEMDIKGRKITVAQVTIPYVAEKK